MQTELAASIRDTPIGQDADAILRRCVHCGFCTATCPTYQVLGDERDSPRGRIYLIKQVLEGVAPTRATLTHLDRCLTCRNCETTCPSGVQYGQLIDIGRAVVAAQVRRPWRERVQRTLLRRGLTSPLFAPALKLGRLFRGILPAVLRHKLQPARAPGAVPIENRHARKVLMLAGCVQPAMSPNIDAATRRVLDAIGISASMAPGSGCCGALRFHLDDQDAALNQMRANIDAWLPLLDAGEVEAIVINASGCGAMVREYAHHLRHDPTYAERARRVVAHVRDVTEVIAPHAETLATKLDRKRLSAPAAFHPPCTLQHWQNLRPLTETLLTKLGFGLQPFSDTHLCCGSAGAYSMLQPALSRSLRDRKLAAIETGAPQRILSANVGCISHLQSGTDTPVQHWVEAVDEALA